MGIKAENLTKFYGANPVVSNLSFQVKPGQILGFIGPNGAGKTTTMRMLCGLLTPSSGKVEICGTDPAEDPVKAKAVLGYLPENAPLYANMQVKSFLEWCGAMHSLRGKKLHHALEEVMEQCALEEVASYEIGSLSKGFRRRVCMAQALIHHPSVLVMDEPTDGLDPNQKSQIRSLIRQVRKYSAVIVSTHILEEIDAVCDSILTLHRGRKVYEGSVENFRAVSGSSLEESFALLTGAGKMEKEE